MFTHKPAIHFFLKDYKLAFKLIAASIFRSCWIFISQVTFWDVIHSTASSQESYKINLKETLKDVLQGLFLHMEALQNTIKQNKPLVLVIFGGKKIKKQGKKKKIKQQPFVVSVMSARAVGHLLPCCPPCMDMERQIRAWCLSVLILLWEAGEGKEKEKKKKNKTWASFWCKIGRN